MKEILPQHAETIFTVFASLPVLSLPFSRKIRDIIFNRDEGKSVLSGETDGLEAAHIDHTRGPNYDDPGNGRMLTTKEHYEDHFNRHGRNGLNESQNKWALKMIWNRLTEDEKKEVKPPYER